MFYTYKILDNNTVEVFKEDKEVPFLRQPNYPNQDSFDTKEEAQEWAKLYIESLKYDTEPYAPAGKNLPGIPKPLPSLDAIKLAANKFDNPQKKYPVIHITGTNGKTSTSRIIESILRNHGLKTGLFTSPHLVKIEERICVNGDPVDSDTYKQHRKEIKNYQKFADSKFKNTLTDFEILTLASFNIFNSEKIDVGIIEVGVGGEWDATNIVDADISVFSQIGLDHTKQLGKTVEEVAKVKSGIIKPKSVVVSSSQLKEAENKIKNKIINNQKLIMQGKDYNVFNIVQQENGNIFSLELENETYKDLYIPMIGKHQVSNAALAINACHAFLEKMNLQLDYKKLKKGLLEANSPGRMEILQENPKIILDAAHNPSGIESLVTTLSKDMSIEKSIFVLGTMSDKDYPKMIEILKPLVSELIVVSSTNKRVANTKKISSKSLSLGIKTKAVDSIIEGVELAKKLSVNTNTPVIVTGSVALVGEVVQAKLKNLL